MFLQPAGCIVGVREQSRWDPRPRDAKIDIAHHSAERTGVDEKPEGGESVDENLAGVVVTHVGIERLAAPNVDEQRPSASIARGERRGQVFLGVVERLLRRRLDPHTENTVVAEGDTRRVRFTHQNRRPIRRETGVARSVLLASNRQRLCERRKGYASGRMDGWTGGRVDGWTGQETS